MVIDDLVYDLPWRTAWPLEANPPLIVDADAVLALTFTVKRFQPIAAEGGEVLQAGCRLEAVKPDFRLP
jgi:hypothetical protein